MYFPGEDVSTESDAEKQHVVKEPKSRRGEDDPPHGGVGEVLLHASEERQHLRGLLLLRVVGHGVGAGIGLFEAGNICKI